MYPFLFRVMVNDLCEDTLHYIVKIANPFDYKNYGSEWMDDPALPEACVLVPDVDISQETHQFDTEQEAMDFIQNWWASQNVTSWYKE